MRKINIGLLLTLFVSLIACGDQLVGWPLPDETPPTVVSTSPQDTAAPVAINTFITANFSEAMDPATISGTSFRVLNGSTQIAGNVTYAGFTATFDPDNDLDEDVTYDVIITKAASDLAGNPLVDDYRWSFTTEILPDTTRPEVSATTPMPRAVNVASDAVVTATFTERMNPLTLTETTFTVRIGTTLVAGDVTYTDRTATFRPSVDFAADTIFIATVDGTAADLAGNQLAQNHVWAFTTAAIWDIQPPHVTSTTPDDEEPHVARSSQITATFNKAMNPFTFTDATFTLALEDGSEVLGTVSYDVATRTATFSPEENLLANTIYNATVTDAVADLSDNTMLMDFDWTFTTGAFVAPNVDAVNLGSLTTFVAVAGAGLTNSNSGGDTTLNGDVALWPDVSCLGDGSPCTITNPIITGTLYAADPGGIAEQALVDLTAAYVDASTRAPGTTVNDISGMVLTPGVYTSGSTMSIAVGGTLTLDGGGNENSVFIFQIGSSLTVNDDAKVELINGASAKNVFWAVAASSTLGANVEFYGSVLAVESNSVETGSVIVGRLLCSTGAITLLSNTITLPPL